MTQPRIHDEAPRDADGNPVHPDTGKRICGRPKSDRTTPTEHGRERDDVAYCTLAAGWGTDHTGEGACKHHGGNGGAPMGEANGAYTHGAYSQIFTEDLTPEEEDAYDELVDALADEAESRDVIRQLVAELILRYKRSGDTEFLQEARRQLADFNVVDSTERHEHSFSGDDATIDFLDEIF